MKPFDSNNPANSQRADRGAKVAARYKRDELKEAGELTETDIQDLFSDLLHLAHRMQVEDLSELVRMAEENFEAETNGELP